MREKKTYKKCARLYPHERNCRSCSHKRCSLRDLSNPLDFNEEHAKIDFNDDNRNRIKEETFVLGFTDER